MNKVPKIDALVRPTPPRPAAVSRSSVPEPPPRALAAHLPRPCAAQVVLIVSFVTVTEDLAKAVLAGTVVSALSYAWKTSTSIRVGAAAPRLAEAGEGWRTYAVDGPLFFGSTDSFEAAFSPKDDPADVVLDFQACWTPSLHHRQHHLHRRHLHHHLLHHLLFQASRVMDHSALEAINSLATKYGELDKRLHLRGLSSDCYALLAKLAGGTTPPYELIEADPESDPIYEVVEDAEMYTDVKAPQLPDAQRVTDLPTA